MHFEDAKHPLTEEDIDAAEVSAGLRFPRALRELYRASNGGRPVPSMYDGGEYMMLTVDTLLPLRGDASTATALDVYRMLVLEKGLAPRVYLPFAREATGDVLFVDCSDESAQVYIYVHDTAERQPLMPLGVGLTEFIASLVDEPENS